VAFTKVLTEYHNWIQSLHHSPLSPYAPNSWNSFSIYIHVYTIFAPYSPSHTLSPPPPPSYWYNPSPHCRTCSALLFSDFVKEKKNDTPTQGVSLWYFHVYM
jgi:hypothetical protein